MIENMQIDARLSTGDVPRGPVSTGVLAVVFGLLLSGGIGCASYDFSDAIVGSSFVPKNVHRANQQLPSTVRRVAILPMTSVHTTAQSEAGLDLLYPVLLDEVIKTLKFEVVVVPAELIRDWTGKSKWTAEDSLPPNLFQLLKSELDCDAVLFSKLSVFRPYPPLAVGWNLKLIEVDDANLLWAADEVVDTIDPSVVAGARRYQKAHEQQAGRPNNSRSILVSPNRFGQYAANAILTSLPQR